MFITVDNGNISLTLLYCLCAYRRKSGLKLNFREAAALAEAESQMPARGFGSRKQDILDPRSDSIYCTAGAEPKDKHAFLRGEHMRVLHRERAVDSLSACISGMYVFKKCFFLKDITVYPQTCKASTSLASRRVVKRGQRQTVCGGFGGGISPHRSSPL